MKNTKKLFALVLSIIMIMSLATTAFAASITIDDGAITGATYQAYKLLNATDGGDGKYAYTVNTKYASVLESVTGETTDAGVVAYIDDVENINAFANAVYAAIVKAGLEEDYETTTNEFTDVDQGYYLIVETALGTTETGATDTYSLLMLDTAGNETVTVKTKEDLPTVEKKVEEVNDSTGDTSWGDSADYDVDDVINYEITGTVSNKYESYKSYYYSFSDTMDAGLTLNADSIKIMIGDVDVTSQFTIETTEHSFTATANLKELTGVTITGDTEIIVTYTATLNENAVSGSTGNKNKVTLDYENNPSHEGDGDPETPDEPEKPGKTPEDVNIVFTYDVVVDKVHKTGEDENGNPVYGALEGAGFTLYKWDAEENDWVAVGDEITDVTTFEFKKLDEGKYKLVETTVPAGYNKAADVEFEIVSTLEGTELTALTVTPADSFTVTLKSGKIETDVVNNAGAELPETGGIGTTIFYTLGGILVLAAVILLVTKTRMAKDA